MNNKLLELFELGGKKNYEFHFRLIENGDNILSVDTDKKIIDVTIGDIESESLPKIIDDIILKILE